METEAGRLERLADDRAREGDYAGALVLRERAFAALRAAGDTRRAARLAAYQISFDHLALFGNQAVSAGWLERGIRLAQESGDCPEAGWVALARALGAIDPAERAGLVAEARAAAARHGDADLHFDALAYEGASLVQAGQVTEGMRRLDEAAAAARGGEVGDRVVVGEIYCKLLVACEGTLDVRRAEEWQQVTGLMGAEPAVVWASAICRMHYGGILVAAGRWDEAESELVRALEEYDASYRALRSAALVRLAELRVRQGRMAEAERLLDGQDQDDYAARPLARLRWARAEGPDERGVVVTRLRRAVNATSVDVFEVPTLALLSELEAGCGDAVRARATADLLMGLVATDPVDALVGYARHAAGLVHEDVEHLEAAMTAFATARLPLEEARSRLAFATLVASSDRALAAAEARAAAETFAWLGARAELDQAWALHRDLGGPARTGVRREGELSDREQEVLALVAQGLSNREIATRLYISPKTASHHVSHLLAKLGLRNRAEAAAWALAHRQDGAR